MRTVSQVVEEVIRRSPFLAEVMIEGVANNAQIARKIQPEVEKRLMEEVSQASIVMALYRMKDRLPKSPYKEKLLKQIGDITVRSSLVEFICKNSEGLPEILEAVSKSARDRHDTFLNFSRGLHETLIIVSAEFEAIVARALKKESNVRVLQNLSAITMRLPERSLTVPGMYYPILKAIATEGISFIEVMSVGTEFSILFEDKDVDRAFSTIKRITS
jgi:hypothetical protein